MSTVCVTSKREGGEDVDLVAIPDRRISKPDERPARNARFVDAPAPKLTPVDLVTHSD